MRLARSARPSGKSCSTRAMSTRKTLVGLSGSCSAVVGQRREGDVGADRLDALLRDGEQVAVAGEADAPERGDGEDGDEDERDEDAEERSSIAGPSERRQEGDQRLLVVRRSAPRRSGGRCSPVSSSRFE